jgi:hypothetical protein
MLLALYFSKARDHGEGEICYTQQKYLSKAKRSKPGAVQVSKHQKTWIRFDPIRFEEIKNRKRACPCPNLTQRPGDAYDAESK